MLKVRTLFSGIGSPESALKNIGVEYEVVDFCEIDKFAIKSYCAIHGVDESKNLGDISKVWGRDLPYADLLVWGFPCQDISVAGNGKGIKEGETRSGLYYEGFRILKETKPKYSIIENVKNLVGKKFKEEFKQMLEDIEELGYNNYWKVLNAKDYGIPQNRERVFIVSIRKDVDDGKFEFPVGFDNGLRLKDFLEDEVDEKFYISPEKTERLISQLDMSKRIVGDTGTGGERGRIVNVDYHSNALTATDYKDPQKVCVPCITPDRVDKRQNGRRFKNDGDPMFTLTGQDRHGVLTEAVRLGGIFDGEVKHQAGAVWDKEGMCPTLDTMQGGYRQPSVIIEPKIVQKVGDRGTSNYSVKDISNTIPANPMSDRGQLLLEPKVMVRQAKIETIGNYHKSNHDASRIVSTEGLAPTVKENHGTVTATLTSDYRIRKLTPLECYLLMGFSKEEFQRAVDAGVSNSQLYKQAGNSIVTNVLAEIFTNLLGGMTNE